ncbi:unnamed protein product [Allacma fusca]|uniref:Fatty acyl-CoA reductase n=1 Tax=Allacma fusca TaxID=39272 RepID=A0A8J2NU81_9HEXA|nr:unnamed protein product [Allacma fusca]
MNEPIFDPLRELLPHALAKVVAIEGDMTLPLLGISPDNLSLLRKTVSVVIHSAATVKFDEPLNVAMNINLGGTNEVLELAESMELIKAVVYVSTAFSNCERSFIEEKVYPVRIDPVTAIAMYQNCDDDFLETITPVLLGDKPNTYVLTKHLAEELVNQRKMAVPVCVVRPSIVTSAYKHPVPGLSNTSDRSELPAYVGDFLLGIVGRKRMFIPNFHKLQKNIDVLTWEQHMADYVDGIRTYAFKDKSIGEGAEVSLKLKRKHQFVKCLVLAPVLMGMCFVMKSLFLSQ